MAYNETLRVKTCEELNILDTYNNYVPPICMERHSISNSVTIFKYRKWIELHCSKIQCHHNEVNDDSGKGNDNTNRHS